MQEWLAGFPIKTRGLNFCFGTQEQTPIEYNDGMFAEQINTIAALEIGSKEPPQFAIVAANCRSTFVLFNKFDLIYVLRSKCVDVVNSLQCLHNTSR